MHGSCTKIMNAFCLHLFPRMVGKISLANVANSKHHQRLDKILIIFTHTIQEISKVVCKKTMSEMRAFIGKLCCTRCAHYSKRMLRKQDCIKFRGLIA